MQKGIVCFLILLLTATLLAGCGGAPAGGTKTPSANLTIGLENEPGKLNPLFTDEHDDAVAPIFSGLTRFNENNEPVPDLAESWEVSPDKLTYVFTLRKGAKWHDGKPVTAEDVKFTLDTILNPKLNIPIRFKFEEVKEVAVIDSNKVKIVLKTPFPPILDSLTTGLVPKHLLEGKDVEKDGYNQAPVGSGPFRFSQWKKGEAIVMAANKEFYRGVPKVDMLIVKFLADPNVRAVQLETGEIDAALADSMQVGRLEKSAALTVSRMNTADYRVLMYNRKFPFWEDVRVRQALNYAVDRPALVKGILAGWGKPAYGPLQLSWANNADVNQYTYNPEKAKALLAEAGWLPGADGILAKDGKRLSFKLTTFSHDPLRVAFINALSTEFKKIGVEAIPDPRERGSFKIGEMEAFLLGWGSPADPDDHTYKLFHSSQIAGGWNYENYRNDQVDRLLTAARTSGDRAERLKLYGQFQQVLAEDPAFNFLVYLDAALVVNKKVTGVKARVLGHHGAGFLWNVEEWSKQ